MYTNILRKQHWKAREHGRPGCEAKFHTDWHVPNVSVLSYYSYIPATLHINSIIHGTRFMFMVKHCYQSVLFWTLSDCLRINKFVPRAKQKQSASGKYHYIHFLGKSVRAPVPWHRQEMFIMCKVCTVGLHCWWILCRWALCRQYAYWQYRYVTKIKITTTHSTWPSFLSMGFV